MTTDFFSRYYNSEIIRVNGRKSLAQRRIGAPETYPDQIEHTIIGNETLDQLAAKYYGREELWWRIADANPNRFPLDWKPGETLVISPLRVATRTPRR